MAFPAAIRGAFVAPAVPGYAKVITVRRTCLSGKRPSMAI